MKPRSFGLLTAFAFIVLAAPSGLRAENIGEISMPAVLSSDLPAGIEEISGNSRVAFILTEKEAEKFIRHFLAPKNEKSNAENRKWNLFKAARLIQTSA